MRLMMTEIQFRCLVSELLNTELDEENTPILPPASEAGIDNPTSGTSGADNPEQGTGYPEVGVWESGANHDGPANPVGPVRKWADVTSAQPSRGKSNKLK